MCFFKEEGVRWGDLFFHSGWGEALATKKKAKKLSFGSSLVLRGRWQFTGRPEQSLKIKISLNASLVVQWLGLCTSTARVTGLIPGQGSSTGLAVWSKKKKKMLRDGSLGDPTANSQSFLLVGTKPSFLVLNFQDKGELSYLKQE